MSDRTQLGLFAVVMAIATTASAADAPGATDWYSILTERGTQIGHASHEVSADGATITDEQVIDVEDEESPSTPLAWRTGPRVKTMSWHTVQQLDAAGRTISITSTMQSGGDWSRSVALIENGNAQVTRTTPSESRSMTVPLPASVRFDSGDSLLAAWDPAATPRLEFDSFNNEAMSVERVVIAPLASASPDADGRITVLREHFEGDDLRAVTRLVLDRAHRIVEVDQPMFGSSLVTKLTDRKTALGANWALHIMASITTKSPYHVSLAAMQGHIRYRFSFRDGLAFPLPHTSEQSVTTEPGFATLDICGDCGPGLPADRAALDNALRPTAWLQSDSPKIREIAAPVAAQAVSDTRKMELLLEKARPLLGRVDFAGHYSALETISRHAANCTDAAVLLAALGRAAGIPTRVASGLVYSRESYHGVANVFTPHSWTLAYADGKWRSFDLALDNFDATHIALTIGDGDERSVFAASQLAGLLHWENMAEIRSRPAN